jgi:hypothetical protein
MVGSSRSSELELQKMHGDWASIDDEDAVVAVDDRAGEEIEMVVAQIKRLARTASLEFALRVGGVIIHHFYEGDTDVWRTRGPKTMSFRRLSQHPGLPLSAGSLYRCVALYELCDRLNAPSRWEHLSASHFRVVLGLPCATQEKLLATANAKRWTVKTLQQEALREKALKTNSGGRRADPPVAKSLKMVRKCLEDHRHVLERAERVSPSDVQQSLSLLEETKTWIERLRTSLRADPSAN